MNDYLPLALPLLPVLLPWLVFGYDVAAARLRYEYRRRS